MTEEAEEQFKNNRVCVILKNINNPIKSQTIVILQSYKWK